VIKVRHVPGAARADRGRAIDRLDLPPMDPRDDLDSLAGGVDVPTERIRVLARRQDIAFVEIHCPACRSESLGIVIAAGDIGPSEPTAVGPGRAYGEFGPSDAERFREALPIDREDVALVHDLLDGGGLAALFGGASPPPAGSSR